MSSHALSNIDGDTVSISTPYTNEGSDDGSDDGQTAGNNNRRLQSTKVATLAGEDLAYLRIVNRNEDL
jgi:hypothetical protein